MTVQDVRRRNDAIGLDLALQNLDFLRAHLRQNSLLSLEADRLIADQRELLLRVKGEL